jgi:hypothetical protein
MGCSIQFESQVEFLAIYAMERDDDVLEYYDQPTRIQLHYRSLSGHKTSPWHTPDFLVIRRNGVGFEEGNGVRGVWAFWAIGSLIRLTLFGAQAKPFSPLKR